MINEMMVNLKLDDKCDNHEIINMTLVLHTLILLNFNLECNKPLPAGLPPAGNDKDFYRVFNK